MSPTEDQGQGPVIRDRRRIDPVTGQPRERADSGQHDPAKSGPRRGQTGQNEPATSGPQRGPDWPGGPGVSGGPGTQPRPGRHSASAPGGYGAAGARSAGPEVPGPGTPGPGTPGPAAPGPGTPGPGAPGDAGRDEKTAQVVAMLAERTADLQRLQAEYANYRKRVERDRLAVREQALANVLNELLPVLDDIGRAREHGELSGGFKSVAESLESIVVKLGLTAYGENGDLFDPTLHEALMHEYSSDVAETTCVRILQPGYKVGDRIIRPARVAVAEPESPGAALADDGESADRGEAAPGDGAQN